MSMQIKDYLYDDPLAYWYNWQGEKRRQSVHRDSYVRLNKAKEQAAKKPVDKEKIKEYVKEFLKANNIITAENPEFDPKEINYSTIKDKYNLKDERDIIWMKFTKDGFLGVVATSTDINFDIPPNPDEYDIKVLKWNEYTKKEVYDWKWNSAGILVHKLMSENIVEGWDDSFVLIFPLSNIPVGYTRGDVEKAVGNYLIQKKVPIIDYFSHMY